MRCLLVQPICNRSFNSRHSLDDAITHATSICSRPPSRGSDEGFPSSTSQLLLPRSRPVSISDSEWQSPQTVAAEDNAEAQRGREENGDHQNRLRHAMNQVQDASSAWSTSSNVPFVLRQNVLCGFIVFLISILTSLEVVSYIARKNQGLCTVQDSEHYLFTYGLTAGMFAWQEWIHPWLTRY